MTFHFNETDYNIKVEAYSQLEAERNFLWALIQHWPDLARDIGKHKQANEDFQLEIESQFLTNDEEN